MHVRPREVSRGERFFDDLVEVVDLFELDEGFAEGL
jgi:hypothetical protein